MLWMQNPFIRGSRATPRAVSEIGSNCQVLAARGGNVTADRGLLSTRAWTCRLCPPDGPPSSQKPNVLYGVVSNASRSRQKACPGWASTLIAAEPEWTKAFAAMSTVAVLWLAHPANGRLA